MSAKIAALHWRVALMLVYILLAGCVSGKQYSTLDGYSHAFSSKIGKNFLYPEPQSPDYQCSATITVDKKGYVRGYKFNKCTENSEFRTAARRAVYDAIPLPRPSDELLEHMYRKSKDNPDENGYYKININYATVTKEVGNQPNFEVATFGLYRGHTAYMEKLDSSPTGEMVRSSDDMVHLETTNRVPLVIGTHFGVEYIVRSKSQDRVNLKFVWTPSSPVIGESGKKHEVISYTKTKKTNRLQYAGYILSIASELEPDYWKLQIYNKGALLHERTFYVD